MQYAWECVKVPAGPAGQESLDRRPAVGAASACVPAGRLLQPAYATREPDDFSPAPGRECAAR